MALVVSEGDLVLVARGLVHGRDVEDAVGVDVESYFDLRDAALGQWDARQFDFAQQIVRYIVDVSPLEFVNSHRQLCFAVSG